MARLLQILIAATRTVLPLAKLELVELRVLELVEL